MRRRAATIVTVVATLIVATSAHAISVEDQAKRILRGQISKCFRPPQGINPPYPDIELTMNFNPTGALAGPPQILSQLDSKKTSAVALRVVSAASSCATLKVLSKLRRNFQLWQSVQLVIRPPQTPPDL